MAPLVLKLLCFAAVALVGLGNALMAQVDPVTAGGGAFSVGGLIMQMGSLGLVLYLLWHVLTLTIPKMHQEHRAERVEWREASEKERAQLAASLSHCRFHPLDPSRKD